MDPAEEQAQEIEILQSIYPDELEILNDSQTHFQISLNLDLPSEKPHWLLLTVQYPPTYPEVVPNLHIEETEPRAGGDGDEYDNGEDYDNDNDEEDDEDEDSKNTKLALHMAETIEFEREDFKKLLAKLNEEAELSIGMPSIFTLVSVLKDEAETLFQQKLDAANKAFERKRSEREKLEQLKFQGTKVTKESWSAWRSKFRLEMEFEKKDEQKKLEMHAGRLTGKEIFEKGLAGKEEEEDGESDLSEESKLAAGVSKVAV
ncbi:uncharacterized protein LODBEIA_P59860 [Lodderomyces beijingensis]|uniref:RWD domain-containing protein n=1 Tax=Lodderomyces beijingensis TaxID=1775926 RepID=A0ABP0ZWY4_9ASCO